MVQATRGRAAAPPAPTPIREGRTRRGKCCASSSKIRALSSGALHSAAPKSPKVNVLPKSLGEKVARLHLAKIGVKLTTLSKDQADDVGVKPEGPYKSDHYRY
jgi:hypothetical protein